MRLSADHRYIFTAGVYTGMRLGEVVSLRWERIDLVRRILRVEKTKTLELRAPDHLAHGTISVARVSLLK